MVAELAAGMGREMRAVVIVQVEGGAAHILWRCRAVEYVRVRIFALWRHSQAPRTEVGQAVAALEGEARVEGLLHVDGMVAACIRTFERRRVDDARARLRL